MKKFLLVLLVLCISISAIGCSSGSKPESAVDNFFKALKDSNYENLKSVLYTSEGDKSANSDMFADDTYKEILKENSKILKYKVNNTEVTGESAVVKVNCTYGDASEIMGTALKAYMQKALSTIFSSTKMSDEETKKLLNDEIQKAAKSNPLKTVTKDMEIECKKIDNKWMVVVNEGSANIMTANMYSLFNEMAKSFSGSSK